MNTNAELPDFIVGDSRRIIVTLEHLPADVLIYEAWFTVRDSKVAADPGIFQKFITTSSFVGQGLIIDNGSDNTIGQALLRFDIETEDSALLTEGTMYYYDIRVRTSFDTVNTIEVGTIVPIWGATAHP